MGTKRHIAAIKKVLAFGILFAVPAARPDMLKL
jgi:hypothetical protein